MKKRKKTERLFFKQLAFLSYKGGMIFRRPFSIIHPLTDLVHSPHSTLTDTNVLPSCSLLSMNSQEMKFVMARISQHLHVPIVLTPLPSQICFRLTPPTPSPPSSSRFSSVPSQSSASYPANLSPPPHASCSHTPFSHITCASCAAS